MERNRFISCLLHPENMDESTLQTLKELISDFPFFPTARMLYLRNLKNIDSYKYDRELERQSFFIPDRTMLYWLLNPSLNTEKEPEDLLEFDFSTQEAKHNFPDLYFSSEWQIDPPAQETETLFEENYLNQIIDHFIDNQPKIKPFSSSVSPETIDHSAKSSEINDDLITDTLAKIYVTQGFYEKALDAYQKLSLKFPEKNSYFAAQIEEIKKLMS